MPATIRWIIAHHRATARAAAVAVVSVLTLAPDIAALPLAPDAAARPLAPVASVLPLAPVASAAGLAEQAPLQLGTWHAIPVAGATCGGPPPRPQYEYFLNIATDEPAGILFVLGGGGACMKDGPAPAAATGAAAQLYCMSYGNFRDPFFNDATFATDLAPAAAIPVFRRADDANPFRNYHFVAVPYCTGDVHAGMMETARDYDPDPLLTFEVLHRGHLNVAAVVDDVFSRFPGDRSVVLTGLSAGGFGAVYNFPTVASRWPHTALVPDAGMAPSMPGSLMEREAGAVASRWGARALLPDYCSDDLCLSDTLHLLAAHARQHDGSAGRDWLPFGLLQGQQDGTLADYLEVSRCSYEMGLRRGLSETDDLGNLRSFVPATAQHVFGAVNPLAPPFRSQGGVDPIAWFGQVGTAVSAADLPANAIDPWLPCNPTFLPVSGLPIGR